MLKMLLFVISAAAAQPVSFPVFLKQGFSTVLEFESAPKKLVLGDVQSFQVERMDKSLVLRALTPSASANLFVFFAEGDPKVFLLTASDDAEPTLYRKFESSRPIEKATTPIRRQADDRIRGLYLRSLTFDEKKDFLTVEVALVADSSSIVRPEWGSVRIKYKSQVIAPTKLWSERKEVQRDAKVRARFIFSKPNLPSTLGGAVLVIPISGEQKAFSIVLRRNK
jgi:hypothetical protein